MDGYPPTPPRGPQVPRAPPLRPSRQPPPILRSEEEQRFFDFLQSLPRAPTHRPVITPEMASSMRNSSAPQANRLDLTNELPRAPPPLRPSRPHIIDLINELPRAPTHRPVITPEMAAYIRQQEPRMNNSQRLQLAYDRESQNRLRMLRREAERREAEEREAEREGRRIFQGSAVARREDDDDEKCRIGPCLLMYGAKKRRSKKKHLRKSYRRRSKRHSKRRHSKRRHSKRR